ncbi:hypothetical protein SAMN05192566_0773 [Methylophilus rhizosphaerae]|uniref:Helix-turn-helix domain-containing protein n=1 Tax=Methylophilus rhizosphaerae TaxID=492660 RepID=A0A1G9A9X3_9PROT|nr:hypothetical protein [Methylophilus rhizosphaerae]SDK24166.1 hypothetical protein SAMN05192566_0773 [Methylophilus rhizosphaerae]
MTPEHFKEQLLSLPPDTPITAEHILAILSVLEPNKVKSKTNDQAYSTWDDGKFINQEVLAEWIGESESTIEKWRKLQKGPNATYKGKKVIYEVGTVREWLRRNTHSSTAENRQSKETELAKSLGLMKFGSVFPSIYIDNVATPFFETIRDNEDDYLEMNFTGYQTIWAEEDSMASLYLTSHEQHEEAEKIIEDLLNLLSNGTDLNELQRVLINGQAHSVNLSHLVAVNTLEHQQYTALVNDFYSNRLNFHALDSNGKTSLQLAEEVGNTHLLNMIKSFDLYTKLQSKIQKN